MKEALRELETIGAIDSDEKLTFLGRRISQFSTHPRLAKVLAYSTIMGCVGPVVNIIATLSSPGSAWSINQDSKKEVRLAKSRFHPDSDHLVMANLMEKFCQLKDRYNQDSFCQQHGTNPKSLQFQKGKIFQTFSRVYFIRTKSC